jgi:hypothetical protein
LRDELTNLEKREEEGSLPASLLDTKTFIQTELLRVIEEEELYWHKRSNQNWLLQGTATQNSSTDLPMAKKKNMMFHIE